INAPLVNGPIWPLPSSSVNDISAEFGSPIGHAGIDIAAELGSDVVASEQGIVVVAKYKGAYGNHLMIDHGNGLQTVYAHCDKLAVKLGDTVQAGQTIATVGQTGNAFEICLYFEVRENGECVDPQDYLSEVRYRF
ncbi:MAG: M23 family metallopeptidase, partial [Acetanaerobacterium sp.]